jgi:hypothetical protein
MNTMNLNIDNKIVKRVVVLSYLVKTGINLKHEMTVWCIRLTEKWTRMEHYDV